MLRRISAVFIVLLALGTGAALAQVPGEDTGAYPPTVLPTVIENTTTTTQGPPPTPGPTVQGRQLSRTGVELGAQVVAGAALVSLGAALVVSVRRRRGAGPLTG